ncbi:(2Fe-2S)-binding protein [Pseudonocardia sp. TRM90224]|uniref:(2Fe-2S)-binding protein n=1 Tax=Pseudonocardia sp. TRM90224 TaxID=2812678 RepID=UPI001E525617|nr:(2Fe-2S)-binding protein [Pseudonocardia sp. TRM90224]
MKGCLMYVCICAAVTDTEIRSCIARGARTVEEVGDACEAGTGCGSCHDHIDVFLAAAHSPSVIASLPATA